MHSFQVPALFLLEMRNMYQMQKDVSFITGGAEGRRTDSSEYLKRLTLLSQMVDVRVTGNDE